MFPEMHYLIISLFLNSTHSKRIVTLIIFWVISHKAMTSKSIEDLAASPNALVQLFIIPAKN